MAAIAASKNSSLQKISTLYSGTFSSIPVSPIVGFGPGADLKKSVVRLPSRTHGRLWVCLHKGRAGSERSELRLDQITAIGVAAQNRPRSQPTPGDARPEKSPSIGGSVVKTSERMHRDQSSHRGNDSDRDLSSSRKQQFNMASTTMSQIGSLIRSVAWPFRPVTAKRAFVTFGTMRFEKSEFDDKICPATFGRN